MTGKSSIEWTEQTWNPIVGCSIVSPGCTNCYAMNIAYRFKDSYIGRNWAGKPAENVARSVNGKPVWTGQLLLAPDHIFLAPLKRKKPTTYFVNSMGDLFHEDCPDEWIDRAFAVMALAPQHTFQVLTKRAERMRDYFAIDRDRADRVGLAMLTIVDRIPHGHRRLPWPLRNVWLGVSTERQNEADERIPALLDTPAAVRFISAEPLLGPIDLQSPGYTGFASDGGPHGEARLDWVIVGGESGRGARPMQIEWADQIVEHCRNAGIPCFVKQLGALPMSDGYPMELKSSKGGDPSEWPDRLVVREMPSVETRAVA